MSRPQRAGGKPYRGVNMMLWASIVKKRYACPIWPTYKQAAEFGGQVRRGQRGSLVVYADRFTKTVTHDKAHEPPGETQIPVPYRNSACKTRGVC